jgi:hypothetical protein
LKHILLIASLLIFPATLVSGEADDDHGLRLLFVGNSLTYTNDLPQMLGKLLEWGGVQVAKIEWEARPDFGLPDHWTSKTTRKAIETGHWDYVILQQGPSATEGRPYLLEYTTLFAEVIRSAGARPAMYMVWPSSQRLRDFPGVADSYRTAASENDALLLPVGEAWIAAWKHDSEIRLYGRDGFHPSRLGTYLAALVMFEQFSERDPRTLPARIPGYRKDEELPEALAEVLQQAASEANAGLIR